MPKRKDIKKVMVIGSGPIVIGQAAEFDYAGTQACLALKEEGYEVILVNSNTPLRAEKYSALTSSVQPSISCTSRLPTISAQRLLGYRFWS